MRYGYSKISVQLIQLLFWRCLEEPCANVRQRDKVDLRRRSKMCNEVIGYYPKGIYAYEHVCNVLDEIIIFRGPGFPYIRQSPKV